MTTQEFIDAIKEMSVMELNDLVKACEEEFGVSAAAGVVVAAAGGDAAGGAERVRALRRQVGRVSVVARKGTMLWQGGHDDGAEP